MAIPGGRLVSAFVVFALVLAGSVPCRVEFLVFIEGHTCGFWLASEVRARCEGKCDGAGNRVANRSVAREGGWLNAFELASKADFA